MRTHLAARRVLVRCAVAAVVSSLILGRHVDAAPVTLDLQMRIDQECTYTAGLVPACSNVDYDAPLVVSFDSDDFGVLDIVDWGWDVRITPVQVTVPWQGLDNVWGGTVFHAAYATAFYTHRGSPFVEYRDLNSGQFDSSLVDICSAGSNCLWETYFRWGDFTVPTPPFLSTPTLADLEQDLHQGHFRYFTGAYYLDANDKVQYLPGSRSISGHIPEPSGMALLAMGLGLVWRRFRQKETGRVAAARSPFPRSKA